MPAQWTADLVGQMHKHRISKTMLSKQLGCSREYVSMVLNGHRDPTGAEQRFVDALNVLVSQRLEGTSECRNRKD